MRFLGKIFIALFYLGLLGGVLAAGAAYLGYKHYTRDLPDYSQLKKYEPPIVTRIYAGDGRLLAEYAQERRVFVPIGAIPDQVKNAFIAAEDQNFYTHPGVDIVAIARAALRNFTGGGRLVGASTITQQVAKNFLLTNERSYERKIREAILATRMEKAMTKDQILELYLNEIYLGQRSYGVAAAAQTYFDKKLDDLNVAEVAYLAALPKAPNNYHPVRKHNAALARRNWVVGRMLEDGYITKSQAELATASPLAMTLKDESDVVSAPFFAEDVRRQLKAQYGEESLYQGGLAVRTSVDPRLQDIAQRSLRQGLMEYDRRHGWRGPFQHIDSMDDWAAQLLKVEEPDNMPSDWALAVVLEGGAASAKIGFADKDTATLPLSGVQWARKCLEECYALGPEITAVNQVLKSGDVIFVHNIGTSKKPNWELQQIPAVQGALVAMDPHTGRVLAIQGGWKYGPSQFNRATQAKRQPGSAFKPFIYLAALDKGFTPATRVLDAPFTMEQSPGSFWSPTNYSGQYYGPTPIRVGVEKSRNLMTVRLAAHLGMPTVVEYAKRFGIADDMKPYLSYALGAGETTLLKLTNAYAMLVNGGKKITPTIVDRIQDRRGKTIYSYDNRPCPNCGKLIRWDGQSTPEVPDGREQIADERTSYQMVSILEGVVQRGTAAKLAELGRPLAGKTGTTNKSKDTWFVGFSPDLVVGVFVGFDDPKSLGKRETGGSTAAPIFGAFMKEALKDTPPTPFRVPPGIKNVRINADTGRAAQPGDKHMIWEAFVTGTEPNLDDYVLDNTVIGGDQAVSAYSDGAESPYDANNAAADGAPEAMTGDLPAPAGEIEQQPFAPAPYPSADDSFTSFSRERDNAAPAPVYPAPTQQPPQDNSDFSGTGGLY
ncbi:MAG: penicillin-binding protein [Micavibrio aeruginosavorus]|uniref:Penicillin-binding protein 1A n=1 Tax=Micavibrio aeruginosavorus TaxID=349221 RepID=A0A2W5N251_9BACT|nr:MAG: penicillin-binding protein [Micavibrio aeruginosavorus]